MKRESRGCVCEGVKCYRRVLERSPREGEEVRGRLQGSKQCYISKVAAAQVGALQP